jgi:hypothetical protein
MTLAPQKRLATFEASAQPWFRGSPSKDGKPREDASQDGH